MFRVRRMDAWSDRLRGLAVACGLVLLGVALAAVDWLALVDSAQKSRAVRGSDGTESAVERAPKPRDRNNRNRTTVLPNEYAI